jgi:hypothetical protein
VPGYERPEAWDDGERVALSHYPPDVGLAWKQPGDQITGRPALDLAADTTVVRVRHESLPFA